MPHSDGRLPSHNVSSQYRMHSYYPAATYLTQGLNTTTCVPPLLSLDENSSNNNNFSDNMAACEWRTHTHLSGPLSFTKTLSTMWLSIFKGGFYSSKDCHKIY